jgi:hypothetical protein
MREWKASIKTKSLRSKSGFRRSERKRRRDRRTST